jgi:hypothetical protein
MTYQSTKAIKGQVIADLVTLHCGPKITIIEPVPWTMFFNESSRGVEVEIGIFLISP